MSRYEAFDRSRLRLKPLAERVHDLHLDRWLALEDPTPPFAHPDLPVVADRLRAARASGAARILMMGAHVIRAGVNRHIIDLLARGAVDHIAMNGAGAIHDYELARIGATTESVDRYIRTGEFGLWRETGELNDWIREAADRSLGLGENIGRRIDAADFPHRDLSIFAAAWRLGVPVTVHPGVGYDIIHEHPNCDGASLGAAAYRDFLIFARTVERLEGGVLLNFGSAIMGPEVYLKALAMARNVAGQEGRAIRNFATAVFDLIPIRGDHRKELPKSDPGYYFRPQKTILVRTVADGGESFYFCGDHRATLPALWRVFVAHALMRAAPRLISALGDARVHLTPAEILAAFPNLRALVVGDVCLDRWCRYDSALTHPSRETGIPRIAVVATDVTPGAAGTVASNLATLGVARVAVLGLVGDDGFGYELERALAARGISGELLLRTPEVPTFTYTKLLNAASGDEDLPRVDFVFTQPIPDALDRELSARLEQAAADFDVILVSDQAETSNGGVVTARIRQSLARIAEAHPGIVIWVDSRLRAEHFRGVIVKPNQQEAESASLRALGRVDFPELRRHMDAKLLVITHGGDGALVVDDAAQTWAPARRVENPVDICGAGDSFSAAAALAFKVTGDPLASAHFGNLAASITIMKKGTGTASPAEMLSRPASTQFTGVE